MYLSEIISVINGTCNTLEDIKIKEIKTDTRILNKGDLFIALRGKNYDGHDYIDEAIRKGASAVISEIDDSKKNCILVNNTIESLYRIAKYIRNQYCIPVIAITGSTGKTTTKDLISHILEIEYKVLKNEESKNNIIGISDTLFKLNKEYDIVVLELGTNHLGEISYLSNMCNPTTSIITNIGTSHIGNFKSKRNIFKEKLSIKDGMTKEKIITNGDNKYLKKLKCYKCGINQNNNLIAYNIKNDIDKISFNIKLDKEYKIVFNNPGVHFVNDILLAIKVCLDHNIKINTIIKRIKSFKTSSNRMNIIKNNSNIIISDCYNSSLESITSGINYINSLEGNKVLIIGDILELGKYSIIIHKKINKLINKNKYKNIYTIGKYSKYIKGINFKNTDELIKYLNKNKIENSYIYIKGSHGVHLEKIVEYLKKK